MPIESHEIYEGRRMALADGIIADPYSFDMHEYGSKTACGTTYCLAGRAVVDAGHKLNFHVNGNASFLFEPTAGGSRLGVEDFAADYLGIPLLAAFDLFHQYELTAEEAAKALLDAPYNTRPIR